MTRRVAAVYVALAGTVLVTAVAAWQVTDGWVRQRAAVRTAVRQHAVNAANLLLDEIRRTSTELRVRLLLPVLSEPVDRPVTLPAFAAHVERFLGTPLADGDSLRGLFEVPAAGAPRVLGALARDSAYRRAVLAAVAAESVRRRTAGPELPQAAFLEWGGEPVVVVFAVRRGAAGRDGGAMGMAFARPPAARREIDDVIAHVALLPAALGPAAPVPLPPVPLPPVHASERTPGPSAYPPREPGAPLPATGNERIGIRWWTAERTLLYATPHTPNGWWQGPQTIVGRFVRPGTAEVIEVAVQPAVIDALVAAVVPPSQRVLLGGVIALGVLFAGATLHELRRQQRLAIARAYFVTAVSHELRTPLAQIRLFSELLAGGSPRSAAQTTRWLGVINREAVRLGGLVENVLLFGRGEADGFRLVLRVGDASAIARDAIAAFVPISEARQVTVELIAPDHVALWADADAVRQVLGNLLDNAVKYGPEGQTVTVRVERRAPPVRRRNGPLSRGAVAFLVDDQGPGIAPADRARIWQPFARLNAADTTASGSGLGLGLVRELVVRQGGRAWVEPAPSGGARFGILLPARPLDDLSVDLSGIR